jgi:hypothetical protein
MRKLMKNSNAVLGIVSIVLATYAEAHAGSAAFQPQRVQSACVLDSRGGAHAASQRVPKNCAAFLRAKSRQQAQPAIADLSDSAATHTLRFAGLAQGRMACAECDTERRSAPARAPPIS